jgi:hypothetical protein
MILMQVAASMITYKISPIRSQFMRCVWDAGKIRDLKRRKSGGWRGFRGSKGFIGSIGSLGSIELEVYSLSGKTSKTGCPV